MLTRRLISAGCAVIAAAVCHSTARAQTQPSSLPPRWGAVQGNQLGTSNPYGSNTMPSTGGLSSLGNALNQWLNPTAARPGSFGPGTGFNNGAAPTSFSAGQQPPPGQFGAPAGPGGVQPQQPAPRGLRINKGAGTLPNDRGQVWREYDITPYTSRITNQPKPEQAVIDWILRETGTEVWFGEPLGILSADSRTLKVYHTPEMQEIVRGVVERFVDSDAEGHTVGLKLVTIGSPNWRARVLPLMTPVDVQSEGVEAWLMTKENAALLYNEMRRRADFRELYVPNFFVQNGLNQSFGRTRPRTYVRSVRLRPDIFPGYEMINAQLEEGFQLQVSPLLSADARVCDVAVKCHIDQVEKMVPISVDVPAGGGTQQVQLQTPQVVSWRLQERFRWPSDQVLLLSCGIVVNPEPQAAPAMGLTMPFLPAGSRSDALLFIENWGRGIPAPIPPNNNPAAVSNLPGSRGRY